VGVADELDVRDLNLVAFADLERHRSEAANAITVDRVIDGDLVVSGFLVILAQLFRVFLDLPFVERLVGPDLGFLFQPGGFDLLVALEANGQNAKLRRHLHHEVERLRVHRLVLYFDELEKACAIK
jgi:hypothetical protein